MAKRAPVARSRLKVHFLIGVLPDIGNPQIMRDPIEAEAPGIAQPISPNLCSRARAIHEGVIGRNEHVAGVTLHINAQNLAEQYSQILAVVHRVAA